MLYDVFHGTVVVYRTRNKQTLSGGDHFAIVCGEEDLRLAVLCDEDLVFAGGSVTRLYDGVTTDSCQVASGHVPQRDST